MPAHRLGAVVHEPVVEALVVAVVEALLLERPLEVPVGLGHEDEVGMAALDRRDHRRPVVVCRPRARRARPRCARRCRSSSASPCRSGRRRTASAIELERLDHGRRAGRARTRSAARRPARPGSTGRGRSRGRRRRRARTTPGRARGRRRSPRTKYSGCAAVHGWSGATWFGTKSRISPSPRSASAARAAARPAGPPRCGVDRVVADAVRRADDVRRREVGQRAPEALDAGPRSRSAIAIPAGLRSQTPISQTASKPSAAIASHSPPGTSARSTRLPSRRLQLVEPDPGVDLVDERMCDGATASTGYERPSCGRLTRNG